MPAATTRTRPVGRLLGVAELGFGCWLSLRPQQAAAWAAGPTGRPAAGWLVRVLGCRSLVQGAVSTARPSRTVLLSGELVDALHATSMLAVIICWSRYRRTATLSAIAAAASALAGILALRETRPPRVPPA